MRSVIGRKSTGEMVRREHTCPGLRFLIAAIVNLTRGGPRGKVAKEARIRVSLLRLSGPRGTVQFRKTGFHELSVV